MANNIRNDNAAAPVAAKVLRYHITFADDSGGFHASAFAESVGGTVISTVQRYNDEGQDLALIDIAAEHEEYFDSVLNTDDNVIRYRTNAAAPVAGARELRCTVAYTDGRPTREYDSVREAATALLTEYPDGVIYDAGGFAHDADDEDTSYDVRSGRIALVWDSEAASVNDDGARAVAEIGRRLDWQDAAVE